MRNPWDARSWRLGAYLGKTPEKNQSTLGWAVIDVDHRETVIEGEKTELADPVQAAIDQALAMTALHGRKPEGIELYRWSAADFHLSRAFREGQSLEQHRDQQREAARRLRAEGFRVIWRRPFDGRPDDGGGAP